LAHEAEVDGEYHRFLPALHLDFLNSHLSLFMG